MRSFCCCGSGAKILPLFDPRTGGVEVSATLDALSAARSGDTVLIHACCHNPTGARSHKSSMAATCEISGKPGTVSFDRHGLSRVRRRSGAGWFCGTFDRKDMPGIGDCRELFQKLHVVPRQGRRSDFGRKIQERFAISHSGKFRRLPEACIRCLRIMGRQRFAHC